MDATTKSLARSWQSGLSQQRATQLVTLPRLAKASSVTPVELQNRQLSKTQLVLLWIIAVTVGAVSGGIYMSL